MNSRTIAVPAAPRLIAVAALFMGPRSALSTGAAALVIVAVGAIAALFRTM